MLGVALAIPRNSDLRIEQFPVRSVIASLQLPLRGATTHVLVTGGDGVVVHVLRAIAVERIDVLSGESLVVPLVVNLVIS